MKGNKVKLCVTLVLLLQFVLTVAFVTDCGDPANCNRKGCGDTFAVAPRHCHDHVDEMNCFRVCKDPAELLECFAKRKLNNTQEHCVLKYTRSLLAAHPLTQTVGLIGQVYTTHLGIPCHLKCRTDPVFWACVHRCDAKGCFRAFRPDTCETKRVNLTRVNPTTNLTEILDEVIACNTTISHFMKREECLKCYTYELIEEMKLDHQDCPIRYVKNYLFLKVFFRKIS